MQSAVILHYEARMYNWNMLLYCLLLGGGSHKREQGDFENYWARLMEFREKHGHSNGELHPYNVNIISLILFPDFSLLQYPSVTRRILSWANGYVYELSQVAYRSYSLTLTILSDTDQQCSPKAQIA